jgi:hypothetical protein
VQVRIRNFVIGRLRDRAIVSQPRRIDFQSLNH